MPREIARPTTSLWSRCMWHQASSTGSNCVSRPVLNQQRHALWPTGRFRRRQMPMLFARRHGQPTKSMRSLALRGPARRRLHVPSFSRFWSKAA
eukprot:12917676-Prorocentrum_lima.AAC.1